jgi:hypothetical protein
MFEQQQLQQERDALMQKEQQDEQRRIDLEMQKADLNAQLERRKNSRLI